VASGRISVGFPWLNDGKLRRCAHSCGAVADFHRLPEHPGESQCCVAHGQEKEPMRRKGESGDPGKIVTSDLRFKKPDRYVVCLEDGMVYALLL
jgi:hypothetical protein